MGGMEDRRPERRFARNVWIAWGLWLLSLLLPAVEFRGVMPGGGGFAIAGWHAALICAVNPAETVDKTTKLAAVVSFLVRVMSLTNVVMAISPITLVTRRRSVRTAFRTLAFGGGAVNILALVWYSAQLSIGYAVRLASFVTLGLTLSREPTARRPF